MYKNPFTMRSYDERIVAVSAPFLAVNKLNVGHSWAQSIYTKGLETQFWAHKIRVRIQLHGPIIIEAFGIFFFFFYNKNLINKR